MDNDILEADFYGKALIYSTKALEMYRKLVTSLAPFYKENKFINFNQIVLTQLFTNLYSTSESLLMLTSYGNVWESDILLQPLAEGTIKYIYMMQEDLEKDSQLIDEYYCIIPELQQISDHEKAVDAVQMMKKIGIKKHPFELSILSEDRLKYLQNKYSKNYISKINKRWSYKYILNKLIVIDSKYESLLATYYSYAFSSHIMHYDGESIRMRSGAMRLHAVENDVTIDIAHLLRIISNVLSLGVIRVGIYIEKYGLEFSKYESEINDIFSLMTEIEQMNNEATEGKY